MIPDYIDPVNSYRYYSNTQIWDLMFILTLKEAEFSLRDIQKYSESKSVNESVDFLEKKISSIERKIEKLRKAKSEIDKKILSLKEIDLDKDETVENIKKYKSYWYKIGLKNKNDDKEMAKIYEKLREIAKKNKILFPVYITKTKWVNKRIVIEEIGILVENRKGFSEKLEVLEGGNFLKLKHKAEYDNLEKTYLKLIEKIENKEKELIFYEFCSEVLLPLEKGIGGILEIFYKIGRSGKE